MERPERWAAAAGIVAIGAGVAGGELVAGFLSPSLTPMTAVGGAIIDAVPPAVKDWAIAVFGTGDKLALLTGMMVIIAALAAVAGAVERRRRFAGVWLIGIFGVVGFLAVLSRAQFSEQALAGPLVAAVLGIVLLRRLIQQLRDWEAAERISRQPARRRFLQGLAWGGALAAGGGALGAILSGAVVGVNDVRRKLILPRPRSAAPPIPTGAEMAVDGVGPLVTPNADFYRIDTALRVPALDADAWTLKVTGMVEREVQLDFAELLAKPLIERHVTISCVSNEVGGDLIGNALWLGWPVRELLLMAGVKSGADMVLSRSADGWTAGTPLEALTDTRDSILAVGMNGEALPLEHGFPVRMIVPGLYGYVSATKWLTELKVTRFADDVGYWTPRGWSERGPIKMSSRIDVPATDRVVKAGATTFAGVAWAQHTGISKVELRVNRGEWQEAQLAPGISRDTWYQWQLPLEFTPGQYEVQVRATDLDGDVQVEERRPVAPDGATGYHTVRVVVTS
ncbi:molybdopterin-dependent oxidoreductase [Arthrobacter sp.]|uniref:molybdopterin-dependent oxidoreductase n=1 Tax=Arthrobacter sp. TaxID=1667 RepID=UPI0028126152|nr:molybdopterin-dependent oxidoreductase [Arthrobacter sp.]